MKDVHHLTRCVLELAGHKKHKTPNYLEAMGFVVTEMAEANEIYFAKDPEWVRNNPENKPVYDRQELGKELADAIAMLIRAGWAEGVDPLAVLDERVHEELFEIHEKEWEDQ